MVSPITVYATETNNVCTDTVVQKSDTLYSHIYDYGVDIKSFEPYTSKTFRPISDRVEILFGAAGNYGNYYTCYFEEQNSNGSWKVIKSYTVDDMGSIGRSIFVTPNNAYRVRVTTTDKRNSTIFVEVYENIFD